MSNRKGLKKQIENKSDTLISVDNPPSKNQFVYAEALINDNLTWWYIGDCSGQDIRRKLGKKVKKITKVKITVKKTYDAIRQD